MSGMAAAALAFADGDKAPAVVIHPGGGDLSVAVLAAPTKTKERTREHPLIVRNATASHLTSRQQDLVDACLEEGDGSYDGVGFSITAGAADAFDYWMYFPTPGERDAAARRLRRGGLRVRTSDWESTGILDVLVAVSAAVCLCSTVNFLTKLVGFGPPQREAELHRARRCDDKKTLF